MLTVALPSTSLPFSITISRVLYLRATLDHEVEQMILRKTWFSRPGKQRITASDAKDFSMRYLLDLRSTTVRVSSINFVGFSSCSAWSRRTKCLNEARILDMRLQAASLFSISSESVVRTFQLAQVIIPAWLCQHLLHQVVTTGHHLPAVEFKGNTGYQVPKRGHFLVQ